MLCIETERQEKVPQLRDIPLKINVDLTLRTPNRWSMLVHCMLTVLEWHGKEFGMREDSNIHVERMYKRDDTFSHSGPTLN